MAARGFELGETAWLSRRRCPDNIGATVPSLIEKLRRRAAKLHRRKELDANAPVGCRLNVACPRRQKFLMRRGYGGERVMQLERQLRRLGACQACGRRGQRSDGRSQKRATG